MAARYWQPGWSLLQLLCTVLACSMLLAAGPAAAQAPVLELPKLLDEMAAPSRQNSANGNNSSSGGGSCCARLQALGFSSNIPVVVIELQNLQQVQGASAAELRLMAKGPRLPAVLCTCGAAPDGVDYIDLATEVRVRGSTSARDYAKKSFAVDTLDQSRDLSSAQNRKVALLGFPDEDSWVFHGPENDRTLGMRNWLAYNMARQMGRYASRTRYFELFLKLDEGAPLSLTDYWGVYQLQEKVSRDKARVDIEKLEPAVDPSGGYMLAYENNNISPNDATIQTQLTQLTLVVEYPNKPDENSLVWIQRWMNEFEQNLLSRNASDLGPYLNVPAAIDYFLGTEVTKNPDGYRGSVKMHKDRGGPLVMGPMWDYNEAFGICCGYPLEGYQQRGQSNGSSGGSAISAAGWRFNICQDPGRCRVEPTDGVSQWYRRLWQDGTFRAATAARWAEVRFSSITDDWFKGQIAAVKTQLQQPSERNFKRWSQALNMPVYGPPYSSGQAMLDTEASILENWVLARVKWMDAALAAQASAAAPQDAYLRIGPVVAEPRYAGEVDPSAADPSMMPASSGAVTGQIGRK